MRHPACIVKCAVLGCCRNAYLVLCHEYCSQVVCNSNTSIRLEYLSTQYISFYLYFRNIIFIGKELIRIALSVNMIP